MVSISQGNKKNILVVDDNRLIQESLKAILQDKYNVTSVYDGEDAVDLICVKKRKVHVIIMDIAMPVLNGIEAMLKIRKHFSKTELPIIFHTSLEKVNMVEALLQGGNDFIVKPSEPFELLVRVENQLQLAKAATIYPPKIKEIMNYIGNTMYITYSEKYTYLWGYNNTRPLLTTRCSLKLIMEYFDYSFVKINKSTLVRYEEIHPVTDKTISLRGKFTKPVSFEVSRSLRSQVLAS